MLKTQECSILEVLCRKDVSTPQHLDKLGMITALVCVWQPNPLWEVTSMHLCHLTKYQEAI